MQATAFPGQLAHLPFPGSSATLGEISVFPSRPMLIQKGFSQGFHTSFKKEGLGSSSPTEITHLPLIMKALLRSILPLKLRRGDWLVLWMSLHRTSPLGLVPKPHQTGKWRLILDLSFPQL